MQINVGDRFGRLTVTSSAPDGKRRHKRWNTLCDCGVDHVVCADNLKSGDTKSCGCLNKEVASVRASTHGASKTKLYNVWNSIKSRCYNKNSHAYAHYGGRGIDMSEEWRISFACFMSDMGVPAFPQAQIDRIDNNLGYTKENCRWTTPLINANNKRNNVLVEWNGCSRSVAWWERVLNFKTGTLKARLRAGWGTERALTTPVHEAGRI